MNCRWLQGKKVKQCESVSSPVVLSGCELEAFCESGDFAFCPVFRARKKRPDVKLSLKEYYIIYSNWVRNPCFPDSQVNGLKEWGLK